MWDLARRAVADGKIVCNSVMNGPTPSDGLYNP